MKLSKRRFRKELEQSSGKKIKWIYKKDIQSEVELKISTMHTKLITDGIITYHGKEYAGTTEHVLRYNAYKLKVKDASTIIIEKTQRDLETGEPIVVLEIYGGYKTAEKLYLRYIKGEN